jgi:hypothetical protein
MLPEKSSFVVIKNSNRGIVRLILAIICLLFWFVFIVAFLSGDTKSAMNIILFAVVLSPSLYSGRIHSFSASSEGVTVTGTASHLIRKSRRVEKFPWSEIYRVYATNDPNADGENLPKITVSIKGSSIFDELAIDAKSVYDAEEFVHAATSFRPADSHP